jgi:hypothetical protein
MKQTLLSYLGITEILMRIVNGETAQSNVLLSLCSFQKNLLGIKKNKQHIIRLKFIHVKILKCIMVII